MAVWLTKPHQGMKAAAAALLALAGWLAGPVLAAPDHDLFCDETHAPALEVSQEALTARTVNSSEELLENHLLKPQVEEAARKVFAEAEEEDEVELPEPAPVIQGLSDGDRLPLRRQMYRRDI